MLFEDRGLEFAEFPGVTRFMRAGSIPFLGRRMHVKCKRSTKHITDHKGALRELRPMGVAT